MTTAAPASCCPLPPIPVAGVGPSLAVADETLIGLPEPSPLAAGPSDLLGMMMAMMDSMARLSIEIKATRIEETQNALNEANAELLKELQAAARDAAEAASKDDDGGFFGSICKAIDAVAEWTANVVGVAVGSAADFTADLVMAPYDLIAGMIMGKSFNEALEQVGHDLGSNGHIADTVKGFTTGVTKFMTDLAQFSRSYLAVIEAGVRGENVWSAVKAQCEQLGRSLMDNIVTNPSVMEVTGWVLKGIAVAGALASGGILGPLSVAVFALSEMNQRYGVADKLFGKEAGQWVSLGLEVAATGFMLYAGGAFEHLNLSNTVDVIRSTTQIVQGATMVGLAINNYVEANNRADEIDQLAETQSLMTRIARLQRLMSALIDEMEEKVDQHQRVQAGASKIYQIQGTTFEASILRA